jgi:hypothetical protein
MRNEKEITGRGAAPESARPTTKQLRQWKARGELNSHDFCDCGHSGAGHRNDSSRERGGGKCKSCTKCSRGVFTWKGYAGDRKA